ncbi:recombinase family protein [Gordonia oryzae]|uniref:recombinase family protein n=1 Tax=Gordonia oryzae TaxID=2487349 RepID=UPI002482E77D|nr:recombinase family protein [Gordonia oryzae]
MRVSTARQLRTDLGPEGLSIPAQRQACRRTADQQGLIIADEYVELGRSATSITGRPALQLLLQRIAADRNITHIIMYDLSRLARNRIDDVTIATQLAGHQVTLLSATENVDNTPVGQLTHGLLTAVNEYRSARDGADISRKMQRKIEAGGTVGRAPIGYINTLERRDGRDLHGVAPDPDHAPLIGRSCQLCFDHGFSLGMKTQGPIDSTFMARQQSPLIRRPNTFPAGDLISDSSKKVGNVLEPDGPAGGGDH